MRNDIEKLIKDYPKHFSQIIKRDEKLLAYVNANKTIISDNLSQEIYSVLNPEEQINCGNSSKNKRFISVTEGYGFCGRAKECQCTRESVSKNVSATKALDTLEKIQEINKKRIATNIAKYGVNNTGKLLKARTNHAALYSAKWKSIQLTAQIKKTVQETYNVDNVRHIPGVNDKIKNAVKEKYGYENPMQCPSIVERAKESRLETCGGNISGHMLKYWFPRHVTKFKDEYNLHILTPEPQYTGIETLLNIQCIKCNSKFDYRISHRPPNCRTCNPTFTSRPEQELVEFLNLLGVKNICMHDHTILPYSKELDIFLPDYNFAIEYNGIYWHTENMSGIHPSYHQQKFKWAENKGIQLLSIFSDKWLEKKEIVKSMIKHKLGFSTKKVFARKCDIVKITPQQICDFLELHHIQGYATAKIKYGLEYDGDLVAVMSFSHQRKGIGSNTTMGDKDMYELVRYASSINVIGGASKLLKRFIKDHHPRTIYTFSDNSYSNGNLYQKIGFALDKENKANYWYVPPQSEKMEYRFKYAKFRLVKEGFDMNKSESEIMLERGYRKIWDCGNKKWIMNLT